MSRVLLIGRLTARDLRHRPAEAVLLLLAIAAATTILTLGLALYGVTRQPYQQTRLATAGPDVVAELNGPSFSPGPGGSGSGGASLPPGSTAPPQASVERQFRAQVRALIGARGVTGHSGPYLLAGAELTAHGVTAVAEAEGRSVAPATVDQPKLTQGSWVRPGAVVVERTFAAALRVHTGDQIRLDGRAFRIAGIAVTAAATPYPNLCYNGCSLSLPPGQGVGSGSPGLIWLTQADARNIARAAGEQPPYVLNLKLADPAQATAFASAHNQNQGSLGSMLPWQSIASADGLLVT
ncbi:MAG TPA: ABC transporter permease, partial [Streptosporangiaceae bacterium]|nr:ABC transporter permease [Streptosporangiaceae bacterium]